MSVHSGVDGVDTVKAEDLVMEWSAQKNLMKKRIEVAAFHVGEQSGSTYVGQIKFVQIKEGEFMDLTLKMSLPEAMSKVKRVLGVDKSIRVLKLARVNARLVK